MKRIIIVLVVAFGVMIAGCKAPSLTSPDPDKRREALDNLAAKQGVQAAAKFMELLEQDPDSLVRMQCAYYLGKYRYQAALALLIKHAGDSDLFVRQDAVWALGELGDVSAGPTLIKSLDRDNNIEIRRRSAEALDKIKDAQAIDGLIQQLDDINQSVAYAALEALKKITGQDLGPKAQAWEKWREPVRPVEKAPQK